MPDSARASAVVTRIVVFVAPGAVSSATPPIGTSIASVSRIASSFFIRQPP